VDGWLAGVGLLEQVGRKTPDDLKSQLLRQAPGPDGGVLRKLVAHHDQTDAKTLEKPLVVCRDEPRGKIVLYKVGIPDWGAVLHFVKRLVKLIKDLHCRALESALRKRVIDAPTTRVILIWLYDHGSVTVFVSGILKAVLCIGLIVLADCAESDTYWACVDVRLCQSGVGKIGRDAQGGTPILCDDQK